MDLDLQQDNQKIRIFYFQEIHVQYNFSFYWVIRTPTKKKGSSMRRTSSTLPCPRSIMGSNYEPLHHQLRQDNSTYTIYPRSFIILPQIHILPFLNKLILDLGDHLGNAPLLYYLQTPLFLGQISTLFHLPLEFPAAPPCRLSGLYFSWQRT
eukprot:snap_masked-scaffold_64-processed-gene-0.91-mRNA-1 protein AED:1.00 eAED:1.00 QI:0/0/0/0/1/1/6/0/151